MRRLPPLNALRAFETVARVGTLARAADELFVTPTAVGRHIKHLEDGLGTALFVREGGQLTLTVRGRDYARALTRAFELMSEATALLRDRAQRTPVTLRALTTFLVRWLIPRLPEFQFAHPEIELRMTTAFGAIDFEHDDVDLGVRYGDGRWPGLDATLIFRDEIVAVGNAALRDRFARQPLDAAFESSTILVHTLRLDDWLDWFDAAGLPDVEPAQRLPFDDMALIYQAAIDGLGIGLTQLRYVQADLDAGRLFRLAPTVLRRDRGFWLICLPATSARPEVATFREWLARAAP